MKTSAIITALLLTVTGASPTPQTAPCELVKQENRTLGPFIVRVSNPAYPEIHNQIVDFNNQDGGGDHHMYLKAPTGTYTPTLALDTGYMYNWDFETGDKTYMVISSQSPTADGTKKLFFTKRTGNFRVIFDVYGGCEPGKFEFRLMPGGGPPYGGKVCVKKASGNRWEVRHSPEGNTKDAGCIEVVLVPEF